MYKISDTQIDFILEDLSARGLEMVSLQQDLLDHICCIIENQLEANGNFEDFYQKTITTFYKEHLWEIEEETIRLQIFKNYYTMKKIMILSGAATAALLSFGILFKFMHWPGASIMLVLGILISSFVFLPVGFTLRMKEKQHNRDKFVLGLGSLCCILLSLHVLFKVQHWPFANMLGTISLILLMGVFLPAYFFSGIRNEETKINTIISSVLMIIGCGLVLTMMRSPRSSRLQSVRNTSNYLRSEQLLQQVKNESLNKMDSIVEYKQLNQLAQNLINDCEIIKGLMIESETGAKKIDNDFEMKEQLIGDGNLKDFFENTPSNNEKLIQLSNDIDKYNLLCNDVLKQRSVAIPYSKALLELKDDRTLTGINMMVNIELYILQAQRSVLVSK